MREIYYPKRPFLPCAVFAVFISLAVMLFGINGLLVAFAFAFCFLVITVLDRAVRGFLAVAVICFAVCVCSFFQIRLKVLPCENVSEKTYSFSGYVTQTVQKENGNLMTVSVNGGDLPKNIKVKVYTTTKYFEEGEGVFVKATLSSPDDDYKNYNYSGNVYLSGYASFVDKSGEINPILKLKGKIEKLFFERMPYDAASTVAAITVGTRDYQDEIFTETVRRCGVSHVMVVSGMHMAIICGAVLRLSLKIFKNPKISAVLSASAVVLLMSLCGFTPSVLRAGITYAVMLSGLFLIRRADPLNSLCLAVTLMIACNSYMMASAAFTLSVLSTAGIIILCPYLCKKWKTENIGNNFLRQIVMSVITTVSALITTLPLSVYYFGGLSLVNIVVNVLISFAVTVSLNSASLGLLFELIGLIPLSKISFCITRISTQYFNSVINFFGNFKYAFVSVDKTVFLIVTFLCIALFFAYKVVRNRKKGVLENGNSNGNDA